MKFRKAHLNDVELIAESMKQIRSSMDDPTMYVIDSADDIRHAIDGIHGFALLAEEGDELAGFFIFRFPDVDEEDHLGDYLNLSNEEKRNVVYMDSAAVFPKYRGQGLQGRLLRAGEELLKDMPYSIALSTIAPDNPGSLNTLMKDGFEIITTAKKYGGLIRHVLFKRIKRPLIGIMGNLEFIHQPEKHTGQGRSFANHDYIESVKEAGGAPVIFPVTDVLDEDMLAECLQRVDGLLIPGGFDIAPSLYGEDAHQNLGFFITHLDQTYITAIKLAEKYNKPVLGICKGVQAINVAYGGTLYQDLPTQKSGILQHDQNAGWAEGVHHITVQKQSLLSECLEKECVFVNSHHHQAVKEPAPGFVVTAESTDGVVEAIEKKEGTPVIGVQWHPELMAMNGDETQKKLFQKFIRICGKH